MTQRHERPGSRAVGFTIRSATCLSEDAIAFGHSIGRRRTTAMTWDDGRQSMLMEARNEVSDGIAGATTSRLCRRAIALSSGNSEERFGTSNVAGRLSLRAGKTFERGLFLCGKWTQRIFLAAGHAVPLRIIYSESTGRSVHRLADYGHTHAN